MAPSADPDTVFDYPDRFTINITFGHFLNLLRNASLLYLVLKVNFKYTWSRNLSSR